MTGKGDARGGLWLLCAGLAALLHAPGYASASCAPHMLREGQVEHVIDAATLRLDDGRIVRLIGALPPETPGWWKKPEPWPPLTAAHNALVRLAGGQRVALRLAPSEKRHDRHDRVLAQAFILSGENEKWVQGEMIAAGYALSYSLPGHKACARNLQRKEDDARQKRQGLWGTGRLRVYRAENAETLLKRRGSYQLVEGLVESVGTTRNWTFLNFSQDWRSDFTVAIAAGDRRLFKDAGVPLKSLQGKRVRTRGWVERWNGPVIKATHAEQIEVLP